MPLVKQNRAGHVIQACKTEEDEGAFRRSLPLLVRPTEGIVLVAQASQSEQPVIDLDTVVYLGNGKIIALTLLDYFTYLLTCPSALHSLDVNFFYQ